MARLTEICKIQWWCSLFLFSTGNTLFGQNWPKKSKFSVYAEIWYLDQLVYEKINGDVHFFRFWPERGFLSKFGPKILKSCLKLNLIPRLFGIWRIQWCCSLFLFWVGNTSLKKFVPKNKNQNLVLSLIWIWRIQSWRSFFLFLTRIILLWENYPFFLFRPYFVRPKTSGVSCSLLNLFIPFLHPFVMKRFRIFVTVIWSYFHCL